MSLYFGCALGGAGFVLFYLFIAPLAAREAFRIKRPDDPALAELNSFIRSVAKLTKFAFWTFSASLALEAWIGNSLLDLFAIFVLWGSIVYGLIRMFTIRQFINKRKNQLVERHSNIKTQPDNSPTY